MKNVHLLSFLNLLSAMALAGKASLGRTKFKNILLEKHHELCQDKKSIANEYNAYDEKEDQIDNSNKDAMDALVKLLNKEISIDISQNAFIDDFVDGFLNYSGLLSGENADAYEAMYEFLKAEGYVND